MIAREAATNDRLPERLQVLIALSETFHLLTLSLYTNDGDQRALQY